MDTCIVLRTALVKDGVMYVQAGAGIVADSNPGFRAAQECVAGPGPCSAPPRRRAALRARPEGAGDDPKLGIAAHGADDI